MGWKVEPFDETDSDSFWVLNQYGDSGNRINQITGWECSNIQQDEVMTFNNWNDLMPVIYKIYCMHDYRNSEPYYILSHMFVVTPIEIAKKAVLSFITFYNKNNGK